MRSAAAEVCITPATRTGAARGTCGGQERAQAARSLASPEQLWTVRQMVYGKLLDHLDTVFGELAVPYMPVKGAYLICAGLAARIPRRRMVDVDILVLPDDFDRAVAWFQAAPHARERPGTWPFEREFYYTFAGRTLEVEIHRALNHCERFLLPPEDLFARGVHVGGLRVLPSAEDALLVAVAHTLVHVVEGLDESRFGEYRLLASQPGFRWSTFRQRAADAGIGPFADLVLQWAWRASGERAPAGGSRALRARVLGACLPSRVCSRIPAWLRRALLEAPFVRRPLGLALLRLRRSTVRR